MVLLKDIAVLVSLASFTICNAVDGGAENFALTADSSKAPAGTPGAGAKDGLPVLLEAAPDPGHIIDKAHGQLGRHKHNTEYNIKHQDSSRLAPPIAVPAHGDRDGERDKGPSLQGPPANTLTVRDIIDNGLNALTERDAHPFIQAIGNVFASFGKRGEPGASAANSEAPPAVAAGAEPAAGAPAPAPAPGPPAVAGDAVNAGPAGGAALVASSKEPGAVIGNAADKQKAATPQVEHQHAGYSKDSHLHGHGSEGTHAGGYRKGTKHLSSHRKGIPKSRHQQVNHHVDPSSLGAPSTEGMNKRGMRRRQVSPVRPYQPDNGPRPFGAPKRLGSMPNTPDTTFDYRQMRAPQMQPDKYQLPARPLRYQKAPDGKVFNNQYRPIKHAPKLTNDKAPSPKSPTGEVLTSKAAEGKYENKVSAKAKSEKGKTSEEEEPEEAEEAPEPERKSATPKKSKSKSEDEDEPNEHDDEEDTGSKSRSKSKPLPFKSAPKLRSFKDKAPSRDGYDSSDFDEDEAEQHSAKFHIKHEMVKQN